MNKRTIQVAKEQAQLCKIFGNHCRVLALWALTDGEKSVSEIAKFVCSSIQNTSQHLRLMKDKGVVVSRRDGQTVYYRIAENDLISKCKGMMQAHNIEQE